MIPVKKKMKVKSWEFISLLKTYTTLGYIVSLILLNLGHVFRFRIVNRAKAKHVCQVQED